MDPLLEKTFLQELNGQCNNALLALEDVRAWEANLPDTNAQRRFWYSVQAVLTAVANISKILFPGASACAGRGTHLRGLLGAVVTDPFDPNPPMKPNHPRNMRNSYDHFDERIDLRWWTATGRKERADYCFYPLGALEAQFGVTNCFRNYDMTTRTLTFMGEHLEMQPVEDAVNALQQQVTTLLATR
jgi:hypothetical protein